MISLKNRVSLVTGASRGIGRATALMLAQAGSDIALNYVQQDDNARKVQESIGKLGRKALLHKGNVGKASVARDFINQAVAEFGHIDIVVNNAGIWTFSEIGNTEESVWDETIEVNLKSVFNVCNSAVPYLKKNGGRVINIASTAGQRGEAFHSHYAASKGGILAFTKSLAVELAPHKVLVNAVAPGWVDTELNDEVFADRTFRQQIVDSIPLGRIATAEDVAGAVLFLASDLANHITGATINVNGGSVLN
ncbi:MAG: putative oxidoreductase [Bacteroidetes bacterium]|nr:putative oxidoreductase [Bacteroidota bacterium]